MKVTTVLFDLDGTLIDSSQGILDSLFKAMEFYKIEPAITRLDSHFFMGKSLSETLKVLMPNESPESLKKIGDYYVSHYYDNYMDKATVFDGVTETIKELQKKGYKLAVATAKHTFCAEAELKAAGIRKYFTVVQGIEDGMPSKPNPELLFRVFKELDSKPEDSLMVGDTDRDVLAGKNAGSFTAAVTYGNWSKEKFIKEKIIPDFFVDSFNELLEHL
jgi:pyrophosphatase PpaX